MNVPALVQSTLGDEDVAAHVPLKGEDAVFVTATRTLVYTAEGLLSDESVDEYSHDAEGIEVSEGRRKATITLDYGLDGSEEFTVPSGKLDDVLHPVLAGVLNAAGVTQAGETVKRTYRFSELTLVVTSDRVVKHVGAEVWGPEYEELGYDAVTGIDVEEGSVSSQLVLETTGRTQRIKAPNEQFRDVRETIEDAVYAYHDAADAEEFEQMNLDEDAGSATEEVSFEGGVEPIDTSGVGEDADAVEAETGEAGVETTGGGGASAEAAENDSAESGGTEAGESGAGGAEPGGAGAEASTGPVDAASAGDEGGFEASGFQTAAEKVEPSIAPDDLAAELDEMESELDEMEVVVAEMADALERQQEVIDAQRDVLDAQQERLAALRELVPDK